MTIPQWAAYRNSVDFHRADEFLPERWMPEGQAEFGSDRKDVLQPFSYGPRNCLGKKYVSPLLAFAENMSR